MKKTLLVNLYAGPCAGKSTICAGIFYELKKRGVDCEMALEFAKEKVWDECTTILDDQVYVFGKQYHKVNRLNGKVDVIITDSPLPLSIHYNKESSENFDNLVIEKFNKFNHIDYFIDRGSNYNENGRVHSLEQSVQIDNELKTLLAKYNISYIEVDQSNAIEIIVNDIIKTL